MNETKQKTAALDIGGVCINIFISRQMMKLGLTAKQLASPEMKEVVHEWECGRTQPEEMFQILRRMSSRQDISVAEALSIWDGILGDSTTGMADAVRTAVSRGWRFIYFSNIDKIHVQQFLQKNDFCHLVSGHVFSCDIGYMKPELEMYRKFEETYGKPDVYFDDLSANIEAGKRMGWDSVLFTGAQVVLDHCK